MNKRPRVLMLFLDGVGIGRPDAEVNPFFIAKLPHVSRLLDGELPHLRRKRITTDHASLVPLNATLGIAGLPQSGTGQTALFTGINAPRLIGKHFGPYPYSALRPVISDKNVFRKIIHKGRKVFYANAYPQPFFDHLASHKDRITVTVMAWLSTGYALNDLAMLRQGKALAADVTGESWVKHGFGDVEVLSPSKAGERLVSFLDESDFVLFDYFFTDHAGHAQSIQQSVWILEMLDSFIGSIVTHLDRKAMTFIMTSDHGNIEDLSTKSHTRNPVPMLAVGAHRDHFAGRVTKLTDVTPAIAELF